MLGPLPVTYQDTPPGFWEWDIVKRTITNPILIESLGYGGEQFSNTGEAWAKLVHPDDWSRLVSGVGDQDTIGGRDTFVEEVRLFHKSGFTMCILFVGKATEFSPDGSPLKMVGSHIDITSQKCRERNLLRLNNLLNETSKTAMVGGWEFEVAGEELNWTDFTKEIFEVEQSFIPQKGDITSKFALPAYSERIKSVFNSAATEGTSFDIDFPIVTARGNRKWIRCTCKSTFDGSKCVRLFGVVQDVTEKKIAREELLKKEQQLSTFIKNCPVAICMLDSEMNYIAASDIWKSFFDLNADEIRGTNHFEIFTQTPEVWKGRYQKALQGEVLKMDEESFILPDGQVEWLEWEIRPWYEAQGKIGGIIIFTAVISEKQAFKEALIHAKEQAEKASLLKSGFLSVMSHEMRTPLNAVIGFINLLLQSPRPDQVENMNVLRFSAENLLLLINDVLDFSKLDAERVQLSVQPFNLAALVSDIVASLKHEADKKGLELKLVADQAVPEFIDGDSARLGQIILNLANNAVKFTHEGSVTISYVLKENKAGSVVIGFEVRDTGIGIPLEQQENIFDMFSQADSDTTRKYGGTGLGLTISKRLLELMGSEIHLTSMPEIGSAFSFDITFCNTEQPQATENETENYPEILHGARILIVEDNPVNILLMSKFLSQWKCVSSVAQDGSIAYDMVKTNDYDLILMDLQMPVMDGYKATSKIRNLDNPRFKTIPIIALSATDRIEIEAQIRKAGMNDFLSKPFAPKQLKEILVRYLRR